MNIQRRLVSMLLALSVIYGGPVSAQWTEKKLLPSDGGGGEEFGWSADIWGHYAVVGAPEHQNTGAAYVFKRNQWGQWQQIKKIVPPVVTNRFGFEVAISGDFLAVLAYRNDAYPTGAAFLYQRSGDSFSHMETLEPPDSTGFAFDRVDLDGGRLLLSDVVTDDLSRAGLAHIYHASIGTWVLENTLAPPTLSDDDMFGTGVAILGNLAVIGAEGDDSSAPDSGAAYVYEWNGNTWLLRDKLKSSSAAMDDLFGDSVSIGVNGRVVVGAAGDDTYGSASGASYLFARSGNSWAQTTKLTPSDGQKFDGYGYAVAYAPGQVHLAIGSPNVDNGRGAIYVYEAQTPPTKLVPVALGLHGNAGFDVSSTGNTILASAPQASHNGTSTGGAAFIYERHIEWRDWDLYLTPWPYIYRYRGCGRTPQDVALTFKLNTDRGVTLSYDTLQSPEHGKLVWDKGAQTVTYVPDAGFAGDDSFRLSAWDAAGNRNELAVDVLVEAEAR